VWFYFIRNGYLLWRTAEGKDVGRQCIVPWITWTSDKSAYKADNCSVGSDKDCMTNCTDFRWRIRLWQKYIIFIMKWIYQDWHLDISVAPVCQCQVLGYNYLVRMIRWCGLSSGSCFLPVIWTVVTYFEADNLYKKFKYCVSVLNILKITLTSICHVHKLIFQISNCVV
jgi:hypothetical protein